MGKATTENKGGNAMQDQRSIERGTFRKDAISRIASTVISLAIIAFLFFGIHPEAADAVSVDLGPIELIMKPGGEYMGSVLVANNTETAETVKIYLSDWLQTLDGSEYRDVGTVEKGIGSWLRVVPSQVTLQPGESEKIYYEVKVPHDKTLSGSYWGVFFVEKIPVVGDEELLNSQTTLGVRIIVRHGVKVYVTIDGTAEKKGAFTKASTEPGETGGLDLYATFENQGNTYLRPDAWLEIRDISGETVYTQGYRKLSILPGISREYKFEMRELELPPGRYIALVIADYGVPTLVAAQAEIEIKDG